MEHFSETYGRSAPDTWHVQEVHEQHLPCLPLHPRKIIYLDEHNDCYYIYRSRPHRKNRYIEIVPKDATSKHVIPPLTKFASLDLGNISWHVAMWFTLGSVAWIVNGQYSMWPLQDSELNTLITGYWGLAGGLLFWIGAYLAVVEALNEKLNVDYGSAVHDALKKLHKENKSVQHYIYTHLNKQHINDGEGKGKGKGIQMQMLVQGAELAPMSSSSSLLESTSAPPESTQLSGHTTEPLEAPGWRWIGVDMYSLGYIASAVQFLGATCFTIAVISGTPGVLSASQWQLQQALIWSMQIVGSCCFLWSSLLLMLEEQPAWYIPSYERIAWHSAFWNVIGSIGFLLSAIFGLLSNWMGQGTVCCQFWGTAFNTYYGSWAFLIASVLMLIEVQNKEQASLAVRAERLWLGAILLCGCASAVDIPADKEKNEENEEGSVSESEMANSC